MSFILNLMKFHVDEQEDSGAHIWEDFVHFIHLNAFKGTLCFHPLFNEEGNNNEIILSAEAVITAFYNEAGAYFDSSTALIMVICSNASDTRGKICQFRWFIIDLQFKSESSHVSARHANNKKIRQELIGFLLFGISSSTV